MKYFLVSILGSIIFLSCDKAVDAVDTNELRANAGNDQTIIVGSYAVFNPTKSTGDFNWYEWQQDENNPAKVTISSSSKESKDEWNIDKIAFVKEGIYKFRLIVRSGVIPSNYNGTDASAPDELVITVNPNPSNRFEDPNLEATVRVTLNKQMEDLDENILLELDSLQVMPTPQRIFSLKGLEYCKNLNYIHMGLQNISNISPLASLTKLKVLALDQNRKISDITPIAQLTELEWLNLDSNLLTDISPLKNLVRLKYLNLQLNIIENIDAIRDMKELETLELFRASLVDISSLTDLSNLKQLWIVDSKLVDISNLSNLNNIINLHLAWNKIQNISPLSNMKKLEWVALEKNNISDISSLRDLQNLRYVRLWDNQITDIKPLVDNPGIGTGDIVGLDNNPLNEKSINEYIPALKARGVIITW